MNEIVWPTIDSKHLIVDSKQMLILEKEMFSDGMPQEALMEKAGIQISRWLLKKKPLLKNGITVFIGPGHNGGDGAVIARELFLKGFYVQVWCPFPIKKTLTNDHLNYLTSIGVTKLVEPPDANGKDLWIDAVFGNNQTRKVDDKLIKLFNQKFHKKSGKVISIDIPTGLCPDKGEPFFENAVKADYTLAIGLYKIGLTQDSALPFIGELHHIDIGVPISKLSKIDKKIFKVMENIDSNISSEEELVGIDEVQKFLNRSRASVYRYTNTDLRNLNPSFNPRKLNPEFRTDQKDPLKFHPNEVARFAKDILRIKEVTVEVFNTPSSAAQNILAQILDELKSIRSLLEKE